MIRFQREPGNHVLFRGKEKSQLSPGHLSTMAAPKNRWFLPLLIALLLNGGAVVPSDGSNLTASLLDKGDETSSPGLASSSSSSAAAAAVDRAAVFQSWPGVSLSLLSSFPEDVEMSDYCRQLLVIFGQRYIAYANCLVSAARPVKVCQSCFSTYASLNETYQNISSNQLGPSNESCRDSILRSDRLMLVFELFSALKRLWADSNCQSCVTEDYRNLSSDTLYFMAVLNQTLTCFEKYQQGNHTELCRNCEDTYRLLNEIYGQKEKNQTMCIDIEDSMNVTRRLWSKSFMCSVPREETVPVIAVSSFMLFLPVIFYLSSFLHSEQKKRKLIHPKRAKSYTSLMNIQDKMS